MTATTTTRIVIILGDDAVAGAVAGASLTTRVVI